MSFMSILNGIIQFDKYPSHWHGVVSEFAFKILAAKLFMLLI